MKLTELTAIILLVALLAAIIGPLLTASRKRIRTGFLATAACFVSSMDLLRVRPFPFRQWRTANIEMTPGTHQLTLTKLADGAHTYRHLLVKAGTDADHVGVCDATHLPFGLADDAPAAAEDPINVRLLGVSDQTVRMLAASSIAAETDVYAAASGYVQALPATVGTYYRVGRTKAAGVAIASGVYAHEVEPRQPVAVVVGDNAEIVTATNVITADETGKTFYLNNATGFVSTLPAPQAGLHFIFINTLANTSGNHTVVTSASANIIKGNQNSVAGDAGDSGTSDDTVNFVANASLAGDKLEVFSDGTSWFGYAISRVAAGMTFTTAS